MISGTTTLFQLQDLLTRNNVVISSVKHYPGGWCVEMRHRLKFHSTKQVSLQEALDTCLLEIIDHVSVVREKSPEHVDAPLPFFNGEASTAKHEPIDIDSVEPLRPFRTEIVHFPVQTSLGNKSYCNAVGPNGNFSKDLKEVNCIRCNNKMVKSEV